MIVRTYAADGKNRLLEVPCDVLEVVVYTDELVPLGSVKLTTDNHPAEVPCPCGGIQL